MDARAENDALPAPFPPPPRWQRWLRSRGLRTALLVVAAGWLLVRAIDAFGGADGIREHFGPAAGLVLLPAQVVVAVSPVPSEIVAAIQVAIYGFWLGSALCWLGWLGAAFLEYGLVRWTAGELGAPVSRERLPALLRRLPIDHPAYLILARFLPFGAHVVNVTAGLHGVALGRFGWTAAVALVPTSMFFAAVMRGILSLP
ncbi:MAG TPA: VTT domain-containing protein [Myxococcota bacterium]|nr:VTT domain-containing protein [Myxococcota bacterium]